MTFLWNQHPVAFLSPLPPPPSPHCNAAVARIAAEKLPFGRRRANLTLGGHDGGGRPGWCCAPITDSSLLGTACDRRGAMGERGVEPAAPCRRPSSTREGFLLEVVSATSLLVGCAAHRAAALDQDRQAEAVAAVAHVRANMRAGQDSYSYLY